MKYDFEVESVVIGKLTYAEREKGRKRKGGREKKGKGDRDTHIEEGTDIPSITREIIKLFWICRLHSL